jgi:hypothetical protein
MMTNELITAIEAMDPVILGSAAIAATTIILGFALCALIRYLMIAIGYSKMYRKAGEAGWKAFIPVYNAYNNYKISWNGKMFFLSAALYILLTAFANSAMLALQLVSAAAGIALIVVVVKQNVKMAKLFGKGNGTGIGLMFFPGITSLILGLGKAEFQGEMIENN